MKKQLLSKDGILILGIIFILIFEISVGLSVYSKIGDGRVSATIIRILVQLCLMSFILLIKNRIPLYLFVFYHVLIALEFFYKLNEFMLISLLFGIYHVAIAALVYFSEEIANYCNRKVLPRLHLMKFKNK